MNSRQENIFGGCDSPTDRGQTAEPGLADNDDLEVDLTALLEEVGRAARKADTAVIIFIDELQYLESNQFAALITAQHRCAQTNLPLTVVGAGLPHLRGLAGNPQPRLNRAGAKSGIGGPGFRSCGLAGGVCSRLKAAQLVSYANQEHRLFGIFQNIDHPVGLIFQINVLAIGEQVHFAVSSHCGAQTLSHLFLQEAQNTANFLQRETFAAEFGNDGHFHNFLVEVDAAMAFLAGRDNTALIPPLQLAQTDASQAGDLARGVAGLFRNRSGRNSGGRSGNRLLFFCFEHFALPVWILANSPRRENR